jgi:hypothetical protein
MEILILVAKFSQALKTYETLRKFILGGEMAIILNTIGDVHARAAAGALTDREYSKSPEREVESAITSLRSAYESYSSKQKKYQAAAAIALCYRFLNERKLTLKYLNLCKELFAADKYERLRRAEYNRGIGNDAYREAKALYLLYGIFSPIGRIVSKLDEQEKAHLSFVERCSKV